MLLYKIVKYVPKHVCLELPCNIAPQKYDHPRNGRSCPEHRYPCRFSGTIGSAGQLQTLEGFSSLELGLVLP
jgi:hypothetical protein